MANKFVTDLTADSTVKTTDVYHVVDTTDTSQNPAGSSYKITWATLKAAILGYFTAGTGLIYNGSGQFSANLTSQTYTTPTINGGTISSAAISTPTLTVGSDANGDLYYRTGGAFSRLPVGNNGQLLEVVSNLPSWQTISSPNLYNNPLADSGTSSAYVITPSPAVGAYATYQVFIFKATNACVATPTLNVNGLGAKTIVKQGANSLVANDILAGQVVAVVYDGTNMQMISPTTYTNQGYEIVNATGTGPSTIGGSVNVNVTCSAGKKVIGGGGTVATPGNCFISNSYPSANNVWSVTFTSNANSASGTITAYAIAIDI